MSRAGTDPNGSVSTFGLKPIRTESQQFESFNFGSGRFQLETNSVEINVSQKKKFESCFNHDYL